jgi:hypothetical protein
MSILSILLSLESGCHMEHVKPASKWEHNIVTTTRPLKMLHMDLFGPIAYNNIGDNKYDLVIIDDYSRFT